MLAARQALHMLTLQGRTPFLEPQVSALMRRAAALPAEHAACAFEQLAHLRSYFVASSAKSKNARQSGSYVHGACETPLLDDTIGCNLTRTTEEQPDLLAVSSISQQVRLAITTGRTCKLEGCHHNLAAETLELQRLSSICNKHGTRASGRRRGTW